MMKIFLRKLSKQWMLFGNFLIQRQETGRIYCAFMDTVNLHTPFKIKFIVQICVLHRKQLY